MDADEQLIARVRQGNVAAMGEFLEAKRPQLLAFIQRQLGPQLRRKVEPDDVFQEVSVDCMRSLDKVDLADRDPFNWLCQLVERRIVDAHRKFFSTQKRAAGREVGLGSPRGDRDEGGVIDLLVASITSPSQAFSRGQREFKLLAALDALPEEARTALRMRYLENLPSKEIAEHLGKTDGAVRVLLTRSLKKLQELLGPDAAPHR